MVVGAFPAAKLGILALKQISKPIANILKDRAKSSPFFRNYVCMPPAQFYNWVEVKTKMWVMNLGKPMKVPQLNEAMAIELGANLLGEFVIFTIGASLLVFEYVRQSKKEAKKEEQVILEKLELQSTLNDLAFRLEHQDAQIRELRRMLYEKQSWLPRLHRSQSDTDGENKHNKTGALLSSPASSPSANVPSSTHPLQPLASQTLKPNYSGNYDPEKGLIFKALNLIENEIFYREQTRNDETTQRRDSLVTRALIYLDYYY